MNAERGGRMWGTAVDGAQEARVHMMGAETWGMAADGARDRAETWGAQRDGMWAHVKGPFTQLMHMHQRPYRMSN